LAQPGKRIHSFPPVAGDDARALILGSIPGEESLKKGQYYGHERNGFWRIVYALFGRRYEEDYEARKRFLIERGIALWDVIESCEREKSLDSNIKNARVNDFAGFFKEHPAIRHVFFNGGAAYALFKKNVGFGFEGIEYTRLKSTSPAHAVKFEDKLSDWEKVREALREGPARRDVSFLRFKGEEMGSLYRDAAQAALRGKLSELFKNGSGYDERSLDCLLNPRKYPVVIQSGKCECGDGRECEKACIYGAITRDENANAVISQKDCTGCGECIERCRTGNLSEAKELIPVLEALNSGKRVYALIAPAFTGQFSPEVTPGKLRSAFKKLGFAGMIEVALFADILTLKEALEFDASVVTEKDFMLTSCCCPLWVAMIRKIYARLVKHMPPSVSPMVAGGRAVKKIYPEAVTVFVGPCLAKKAEARMPDIADAVDYVITFTEASELFGLAGIVPEALEDDAREHSSAAGRIYARTGGVSEAVRSTVERLMPGRKIRVRARQADGVPACKALLKELTEGNVDANFIEGMGCVGGCVGGPRAILDRERGASNVDAYAAKTLIKTPADNPYLSELLSRLGFSTIESLRSGKNSFTREFGE